MVRFVATVGVPGRADTSAQNPAIDLIPNAH